MNGGGTAGLRPIRLVLVLAAVFLLFMALPSLAVAQASAEDCVICHPQPQSHVTPHSVSSLSGHVQLFSADHEGAGTNIGADVDCGICHDISNVAAIHGNRCSTCHPSPRNTFTSWTAGCLQGGCHNGPIHPNAAAGHASAVKQGFYSGCVCHDIDTWAVSQYNCGQCHTLVDHTAPVTTSDARTVYVGPGTIQLSASDLPSPGGSGLAHTYYTIDGGTQREGMSVTVTSPPTGTLSHTLEFWSVDGAGNVETPHKTASYTVTADTTPPSTTSNAKAVYYGPATITMTVTDNGTTRPTTYYILDGGSQTIGTAVTVPQPPSGSVAHTLEFWSVDAAGNAENPHKSASFSVVRDSTPPTTTTDAKPFYRAGVENRIDYTATDTASGVAATYYQLDGGGQTTYPYVRLSSSLSPGTHTLEIWSVDNAGNAETHKVLSFTLDGTAPTTASDIVSVYSGAASIHLTPSDGASGSGVATTYYKLDGGVQSTGTTLTVSAAGAHILEFWSVDNVGNTETPHKSKSFTILGAETVPPVTTSDVQPSYPGPASIHLTATDNTGGSGVAVTYYKLDGGTQSTGTSFTVSASGSHTLEFWSVDNAGNVETPHKTASFTITGGVAQGTVVFWWDSPPSDAWADFYVDGVLVGSKSQPGWDGSFTLTLPVRAQPYSLSSEWWDSSSRYEPDWSYGSALIDTPNKVVTWYY